MKARRNYPRSSEDPAWIRWLLIGISAAFVLLMLIAPLLFVFFEAFSQGWHLYVQSLSDPDVLASICLTLLVALVVVPVNTIIGLGLAWLIARYHFRGKQFLTTLLDLPFAISPVTAGLMFVLIFSTNTLLGGWLSSLGLQVIYALPGIILATLFVTFPFVAKELIPLMQSQGSAQEQAALTLGASGWQMFWHVTLPNVRWALLYGLILTNARAIGEFGAVSVVSGHIRGLTVTMPLQIEISYNEYDFVSAFAASSLLALLAILTLLLQNLFGWLQSRKEKHARAVQQKNLGTPSP